MNFSYGSVCSGIEAASVAWQVLGWRAAWLAEVEAAPSSVLAHRWPDAPNLGDMTKLARYVRAGLIEAPDVLVGGTPCQAFSIAGLRGGLTDARGQLTLTYVDLANAIDERRNDPCVVVWENVPGVLSDATNAFGCFLGALAGEDGPLECAGGKWPNAGVVVGPQRAIAWRIVDAQYFGVAQRRRRVLLVASARDGFDPAAVLFEFEGVRRDSAPRRETGQDAAAGTLRGSSGGCDVDHAAVGHLQPVECFGGGQYSGPGAAAATLKAHGDRCDYEGDNFVLHPTGADGMGVQADIAYTLEARAEVQAVAFSCKDHGADASVEIAPTLRAMGRSGSHANAGGQLAVCVTGSVTHALKAEGADASEDGTGRGNPIVPVLSFKPGQSEAAGGVFLTTEFAPTLQAANNGSTAVPAVQYGRAVRRLTPRECERLQGFPDDYTLVPHRGKPMADGPRYKALGNSMCVFKMRWLGVRLMLAHPNYFY